MCTLCALGGSAGIFNSTMYDYCIVDLLRLTIVIGLVDITLLIDQSLVQKCSVLPVLATIKIVYDNEELQR